MIDCDGAAVIGDTLCDIGNRRPQSADPARSVPGNGNGAWFALLRSRATQDHNMPKAPRNGHGIELIGRNEEQPADEDRALDPSAKQQDEAQEEEHGQNRKREGR